MKVGRTDKKQSGSGTGDTEEDKEEEQKGGGRAMKKLLDSLPSGLLVVTNFGLVDICPERSGKHNAAAYLAKEHFGISLGRCASMGDDDNDIALVRYNGVPVPCQGKYAFFFSPHEEGDHVRARRSNFRGVSK